MDKKTTLQPDKTTRFPGVPEDLVKPASIHTVKEGSTEVKTSTRLPGVDKVKTVAGQKIVGEILATQGVRYDEGKLRYDLVPALAQKEYVKVLTKGAEKYADRNWEKGMKWSRVLASLKRHLAAIELGEDRDPETGLLHSAHIMCNAAFITQYYHTYPQGDDRPLPYLNMPKIGLDIDEVLCDWVGAWVQKFNMDVPKSWFFDYNIMDRFQELREKGELDDFYLSLKPKMSPCDIPFEPSCYVTSRPVDTTITVKWLEMNKFPTAPVYTVPAGTSKVDVILKSGIDIFVDDRYDNFVELNKAGICTFLWDTPHNARYNVGYKRITSLKQLLIT